MKLSKIYLKLSNVLSIILVLFYNLSIAQNAKCNNANFVADSVIIKLPKNRDGRFIDIKQLYSVKAILKNNNYEYTIKINVFFGTEKFSQTYSNHLKASLEKYLHGSVDKIKIISNGSSNPLIRDKKHMDYKNKNNRIVILRKHL
ncbi:hypothetical protein [Chryseobacterium indoltheticum]|jgi:hypothetical protein|uniref:hypothetical protein n=1 Tax=Chryseobacterium indoltheticum TaxID=254 RepID=UPI00242A9C00|nr:hypothetical protein [Chryseobacterium indoltheticum]MDF2833925.1 hypothetical protein [Chryseobacterium indoltheticum]